MRTEFWAGKTKVYEADLQVAPQPGDTVLFTSGPAVTSMTVTSRKFILGADPALNKLLVYGGPA